MPRRRPPTAQRALVCRSVPLDLNNKKRLDEFYLENILTLWVTIANSLVEIEAIIVGATDDQAANFAALQLYDGSVFGGGSGHFSRNKNVKNLMIFVHSTI